MWRIFKYQGQIDEAFKKTAKQSLIEGGWNPIVELDHSVQLLTCSGPDRQTCKLSADYPFAYAIVAERP